jgi:hypothetical protein
MRTGPNFRSLQITLKNRSHRVGDVSTFDEHDEPTSDRVRDPQTARLEREEVNYHLSTQFRLDVIADLIDEGCTRAQAEGRTRDQARLFREAQRLGGK